LSSRVSLRTRLPGVDDQPLPPQLEGDAPVAVMAVFEGDAPDEVAQVPVLALGRMRSEMPEVRPATRRPTRQALDIGVPCGSTAVISWMIA
jgi:hypothetical protein